MAKTICIDAGHGGTDPGAVGNSLKEKDITLKLAKKVGSFIKEQGIGVIYTRTADKYVALGERCRIANNNACDLFVSVHINSAVNTQAGGIETLCYTKNNLAYYIQNELIAELKLSDRGVKERKDLYVLNSTDMQAVLVELGFISNKNEAELLKDNTFLERAAVCIAKGICKYIGVEYKEVSKTVKTQMVTRQYKYKDIKKDFEVVNIDGKNYISVRDIADLIGKKVSYSDADKVTEITD